MGFVINYYDPCVANKIVNGKQLTVCWHVDDLKISHANKKVVSKFLKQLEKLYGELRTTRGKVHDYLGMTLNYRILGKVQIDMTSYTKATVEMFPNGTTLKYKSPAVEHLYDVNEHVIKLTKEKKQMFHTITVRSLFAAK